MTLLAAALVALAAALFVGPRPWLPAPPVAPFVDSAEQDRRPRRRVALALGAGAAGPLWLAPVWPSPPWGLGLGLAVAAGAWVVLDRSEPAEVRRARQQAAEELPHVVGLLALTLASGAAPATALQRVSEALPGPATNPLGLAASRLSVGVSPEETWAGLAAAPGLAPLGMVLGRSQRSGAPVAAMVARLGADLAAERRAAREDQARTAGVRAAVPLGLCLLPAFLLLGIVPVVATSLPGVGW